LGDIYLVLNAVLDGIGIGWLGERIEKDMIAVRVLDDFRVMAVASGP
jgi:hypothetical protein